MSNELGRILTRRLLEELRRRRWTPTDLARAVGVAPSTVTRNIRTETFPAPDTVVAYAKALGIPVSALFRENNDTAERLAEWLAVVDVQKLRTILPTLALAVGSEPPDLD